MSVNNQYSYLLPLRMQQKKAAREAQALLDTQWNVEYSAAEAAWRIERDQARAEHRKPPKEPLKPLRPRVVDMGVRNVWRVWRVRGVWRVWRGVEGVEDVEGEECEEGAQDMEALEDQEKEELAEMILELNIAEFCIIRACKQHLPILPYTYMFYSNTKVDD